MALLARHRLATAIVLAAVATAAGLFAFARPRYRPATGMTIKLPAQRPAALALPRGSRAWRRVPRRPRRAARSVADALHARDHVGSVQRGDDAGTRLELARALRSPRPRRDSPAERAAGSRARSPVARARRTFLASRRGPAPGARTAQRTA